MRSGTSFFDWTLFKKDVARFWPIWASYLVLWLFLLPVSLLMSGPDFYWNIVGNQLMPTLVFNVIYAPLAAMAVLSHLYSARSANFFGALPIRREGQFVTQYLAGLSFLIVPDVIVGLLAALVLSTGRGVPVSHALLWLLTSAGEGFFFYSMAILLGLLVGHILALPAIYAVGNFLVMLTVWLAEIIARTLYPSFSGFSEAVGEAAGWLTPAEKFSQVGFNIHVNAENGSMVVEPAMKGDSLLILAAYAGAAVLLTGAAFLLYRSRRMESAGDVVAVRAVRPVFKYLGAVCTGMALGVATSAILGEETLTFTITAWTLIGCFAAQMVLDKSFRVFKKWKGAAVLTVLTAAALAVMVFDLTGFMERMPDLEDVESLTVSDFNSTFSLDDSGEYGSFTLTDKGQIAEFMELHRAAIKSRDDERDLPDRVSFRLAYRTRSGELVRYYSLRIGEADTPGTGAAALKAIFEDRELWRHIYGLDRLAEDLENGGRIQEIVYYYRSGYWGTESVGTEPEDGYAYFEGENYLHITEADAIHAIYGAVTADFEEGLIGHRELEKENTQKYPIRKIQFIWTGADGRQTLTIRAARNSERTLETLFQLLPGLMEAQGLA